MNSSIEIRTISNGWILTFSEADFGSAMMGLSGSPGVKRTEYLATNIGQIHEIIDELLAKVKK